MPPPIGVEFTATKAVDVLLPSTVVRVIVQLPAPFAVTRPVAVIVATLVLLDCHDTLLLVAFNGVMAAESC